jgi:D-alanyl-D-alanine carboxypeptidase/D-alanyl-D-alanine-endopeptidase (penicillin-binding protein 4)
MISVGLAGLLAIVLFLQPASVWARKKKAPPPTLTQQVEQILGTSPIANGFFGIKVFSLDRNQVVFEKDADHLFVPASNTKIFTTTTAIAKLPADFRFTTTLESNGRIDKFGRLTSDLYFVGRGDPNLSNRILPYDPKAIKTESPLTAVDTLTNQLVAKGVKVIDGDIIGDDTYYINEPFGESWGWDDLMWSSGAPVSALTINDNVFSVSLIPGEMAGDRAFVTLDPLYPSIQLKNDLVTTAANSERHVHMERLPGSSILRIWGTLPLDAKPQQELLAIEEPARVAAEALRDALKTRGVILWGNIRTQHSQLWQLGPTIGARSPENLPRTVLAQITSHSLREDLKVIAKVSQNLHAEMLLRLLGAQLKNEGSVRAGLAAEKEFLNQAGVDEKDYHLNDGSGMDSHNLVAPNGILQLLKYVWSQPYRDAFIDLLPIGGIDGTIGSRFKETVIAGKVLAKTGTLTHVNALSGFATSPQGEHFVFSMIANNHTQNSKTAVATMDKILETILTYTEPGGSKLRKK